MKSTHLPVRKHMRRALNAWEHPSTMRRCFVSGLTPKKEMRLRQCGVTFNMPRGRSMATSLFEKRLTVVQKPVWPSPAGALVVDCVTFGEVEANPAKSTLHDALGLHSWDRDVKIHLQRNGDTFVKKYGGVSVIHVLEPDLRARVFRLEEAQVELISTYRNILLDFLDVMVEGGVRDLHMAPLSMGDLSGDHRKEEMVNMNHQAILKGFHRIPNDVKDRFSIRTDYTFHVCVPVVEDFVAFEAEFKAEAWVPGESIMHLGRKNMYYALDRPSNLPLE